MAVYVDALIAIESREAEARRVGARHGHRWCHMLADTLDELHAMAARIGMKRAWFQNHNGLPHYDLVPTRRARAVQLGAVEVDRAGMVAVMRRLRAKRTHAQEGK